jgi:hypothetical protein
MNSLGMRSGGIVGFSTFDLPASIINIGTFGVPGIGIHHVGILSRDCGKMMLFESTTTERPPCFYTGECIKGVGARSVSDTTEFFKGRNTKLWYYGLRSPLYCDEEIRLQMWLRQMIGTPYDMDGAVHAAGFLFNALSSVLRGEDLSSLFCSEMSAAALSYIDRLQIPDASRWNPNKLVRHLVRHGICNPPERIL